MEEARRLTEEFMAGLSQLSRQIADLDEVGGGDYQSRLEEVVHRQADAVAETFSRATDAIFLLDAGIPPVVVECNEAASSIFGYERREMVGRSIDLLHASDETLEEFQVLVHTALGNWRGWYCLSEFGMRRKDGSLFAAEHAIAQLVDEGGERTGWVDVVRDISGQSAQAQMLMLAGALDGVTGLPNRMLLHDRGSVALAEARRRGLRVGVMLLSLDWPLDAGRRVDRGLEDLVMWQVSQRIKQIIRKSDTLARNERNELAILLPGLESVDGAGRVADRVLAAVSRPYPLSGREVSFRTSIGIAFYPDDSEDFGGVVRRAHAAMYCARRKGGDGYEYYAISALS